MFRRFRERFLSHVMATPEESARFDAVDADLDAIEREWRARWNALPSNALPSTLTPAEYNAAGIRIVHAYQSEWPIDRE